LLTTFSIAVIGMRCDTPERLSTRLSVRASKAHALDHLAHELGARAPGARVAASLRCVHASCCVIAHPELDLLGVVRHDLAPMRSLSGVMILPRAV
jgi:hypothetical protein